MAFVKKAQVMEVMKDFVPADELPARFAEALGIAKLRDNPHYTPEEVSRLGRAMMVVAKRQMAPEAAPGRTP
jgi:hypothetical protein